MQQQLAPLGVSYTFIDAIDGKNAPLSEFKAYNSTLRIKKYGRDLKNTEVATTLSHLKALKHAQHHMKKHGDRWAVILEDDSTILPSFISALNALDTYPEHVHCVRLYERVKNTHNAPDCMDKNPDFSIHRSTYKNWGGALGYAVRISAIQSYIRHNSIVLHKADKMLFGIPYDDVKLYQHRPRSVRVNDTITSDIGYGEKHRYTGIRNNIIRIYMALIERLHRIIYRCKYWREYRQ